MKPKFLSYFIISAVCFTPYLGYGSANQQTVDSRLPRALPTSTPQQKEIFYKFARQGSTEIEWRLPPVTPCELEAIVACLPHSGISCVTFHANSTEELDDWTSLGGDPNFPRMGDKGAEALATVLFKLRRLSLTANEVGDRGAKALAAGLTSSPPLLEELNLYDNNMEKKEQRH